MDWLNEPDNPYFARNIVNRVWAMHFGRGLVEPLDGFSAANPPTHPELFDELADDFVAHGYDLRRLERLILNSTTWQLSSRPMTAIGRTATHFARSYVRMPPPRNHGGYVARRRRRPDGFWRRCAARRSSGGDCTEPTGQYTVGSPAVAVWAALPERRHATASLNPGRRFAKRSR